MAYSYKYNPISSVLDLVDSDGFTYGVWGYVTNYSALPLGITTIDPQIGDLVGVDTSQGVWPINYRASGFYRRIAMTGLATTDYGTSPFAGYPNTATQAEVDAGLLNDKYVSPITYQNGSKWLTKEDISNKSISVVTDQASNIKYPSVKSVYDWVTSTFATIASLASYVTLTGTQTLTNKRITQRVTTIASSATPTPNADTDDEYTITALAASALLTNTTGTPTEGQSLLIRIKDNGTARALTFDTQYRFSIDLSAPTTTIINKTLYIAFIWNNIDSKWDCVGQLNNF